MKTRARLIPHTAIPFDALLTIRNEAEKLMLQTETDMYGQSTLVTQDECLAKIRKLTKLVQDVVADRVEIVAEWEAEMTAHGKAMFVMRGEFDADTYQLMPKDVVIDSDPSDIKPIRPALRWFKFASPKSLTQHGCGSEEEARMYVKIRSRCHPGTTYVEVDGEPNEAATVVNLDVAISMSSPRQKSDD